VTSARRTLLTATAAGTLLGALWFVPSAGATVHASARTAAGTAATHVAQQGRAASMAEQEAETTTQAGYRAGAVSRAGAAARVGSPSQADSVTEADSPSQEGAAFQEGAVVPAGTELADTGSINTTPYVVGGALFLAVGAGFVSYSVRRERLGF
jgi:LPXTG-motif cell wall-anchored protein